MPENNILSPDTEARLQKLRAAMQHNDFDALVISNPKNIFYYSSFAGQDSYLLVTLCGLFLLSDGRFIAQAADEAPEAEFLCRQNGQTLGDLLLSALPEDAAKLGFEGYHLTYAEWANLADLLLIHRPDLLFEDCGDLPLIPRLEKAEYELACLQKCGEIADQALTQVLPQIKVGMTEKQIACLLEQTMQNLGGDGTSFTTIVAAGANSAKPHAIPSDYAVQPGDFITLDFGCIYRGYCGDCTRTVSIGEVDEEKLAAYQLVRRAQQQGVERIKPGMTTAEADRLVRQIIDEAGMGQYFSHSLGHGVGLDIHETPSVGPIGSVVITPGQVITVEPGVYIPGRFGLRIEDSCIVTEDGLQPLTHFERDLIQL